MSIKKLINRIALLIFAAVLFSSCNKQYSSATGWEFNDPENGGYQVMPFDEQSTGPNLVLIEGGQFTMGRTEQDVMYEWNNQARTVTVNSFYLDQTEVSNLDYLEYLYWLNRVYGESYKRIYTKALPDTACWREKLEDNEKYVRYYLRHPAYRYYPVVGVSWLQARDFCKWRTDRVNEIILIDYGILEHNVDQRDEETFQTDAYLAGKYNLGEREKGQIPDLGPSNDFRIARVEDGILLPEYRLPTEAEWEFAALGLIGNTLYERIIEKRIYPWNGHITRTDAPKNYGDFVANFMRGKGDYMGIASNLNDAADITAPVFAYWPNDYGLYNMAGNVSEWVMDVYRPMSSTDMGGHNPFRGNVYQTVVKDNSGAIAEKLDYVVYDYASILNYLTVFGEQLVKNPRITEKEKQNLEALKPFVTEAIKLEKDRLYLEASEQVETLIEQIDSWEEDVTIGPIVLKNISNYILRSPGDLNQRDVRIEENLKRRNYKQADNINFLDGDFQSTVSDNWNDKTIYKGSQDVYDNNSNTDATGSNYLSSMLSDKVRVYKGASWRDRAYWLSPGNRRYLDQELSSSAIGFRCAMYRLGSPIGKY